MFQLSVDPDDAREALRLIVLQAACRAGCSQNPQISGRLRRNAVSRCASIARVLGSRPDLPGPARNARLNTDQSSLLRRIPNVPRRRATRPARGQTRSNFLEERLAEEIISGRLLPGTRLEEQAIADRFETSRTPVREALRRLEATGLIEIRPRRGVVVSNVTRERLAQMFEAMAELEGACARLAAERMTDVERDSFSNLHAKGEALAEDGEPDAYEKHNRKFHAAIYAGSANEVLEESTQAVRARLAPFRSAQFQIPGRIARSNAEHSEVVEAILARDGNRAYDAMRRHMLTVSDASAVFATREKS